MTTKRNSMPARTRHVQDLDTSTIAPRIATIRERRVLLDSDLAALYEVETKRFNEAVRRNLAKFPADFMFQLTTQEWEDLRSQIATLRSGEHGRHRKYLPYAFTEHGAIMAANLLSSPRAIEVSVYVVRAFVRMRELATVHGDLAQRLAELEAKAEALAASHEALSHTTRVQLKQVFEALRALVTPPDPPKRPIGFIDPGGDGLGKNRG